MGLHRFKVSGTGAVGAGYNVELDGEKLDGVVGVNVYMGVRDVNEVTLTLLSSHMDIDLPEAQVFKAHQQQPTTQEVLHMETPGQPSEPDPTQPEPSDPPSEPTPEGPGDVGGESAEAAEGTEGPQE